MIDYVRNFIESRDRIKINNKLTENRIKYYIRSEYLKNCIYNSSKQGVTDEQYCSQNIIVSLTTYGKRLNEVALTIESIMQGSMLPNKIVLWLDDGLREKIMPIALQLQVKRGLEISFYKDIRSYKKLIPSLHKYPNDIIITIDDDLLYEFDLIENLYLSHLQFPNSICASRMHKIVLNKKGKPVKYNNWKWCVSPENCTSLHFPTTGAGTLFPPNCFDEDVFDESVFMDICKYADDVWFYCMALKNGTPVIKCYTHNSKGEDYFINHNVQDIGLSSINVQNAQMNNIQLYNVLEKYNLFSLLHE